jgi:hypothetical protein
MNDASGRLDVLVVTEYDKGGEKKSRWTRIGAAFPAKDGPGYTILLDALPIGSKLILRPPSHESKRRVDNLFNR